MSYSAAQGEICSLASHLGLQVCLFVYFSCLYSFSPWTAVSPSIEGFLSAPCCVLSPLVRSSCLLHQRVRGIDVGGDDALYMLRMDSQKPGRYTLLSTLMFGINYMSSWFY